MTFSSPVASYDLNQILYDYTVDVTSRFKGLDLIDRVPDELCPEVLVKEKQILEQDTLLY